jgi:serine/threonine-protein kinase
MSSSQETTRICLACGLETQDLISNCPVDGSLLTSGVSDPLLGTTFMEKYQITGVLGRGGMASVYKAKHLMMNRFVAIKFLRSELVHDNVMLQRFQLESKAVSLLKHPNIITVHDFGLSAAGVPYLIMDYLEGKSLSDVIEDSEHIEPTRCVALFTQICNALAHTHSKGVIHRDIKPSNVMISIGDDGQEISLVVDFGIAKLLEQESGDFSKLTASGEVFGSPAYMSPEQCNGSAIDARTDIYALGCVLYNSLVGRPPLLGKNAMETVLMHIRDMPRSFGEVRPDLSISPVLERAVFKALAKDPDERFKSMSEFGAELSKSLLSNNTTWVIPAQKPIPNQSVADVYGHTTVVPVKSASDAVSPEHPISANSRSSDTGEPRNSGRMNPNSMIMPGSDLFGYDSLSPALPDQPTKAEPFQMAAPAKAAEPFAAPAKAAEPFHSAAPSKSVEPIPLAAPAKLQPPATIPSTNQNAAAVNDRGQVHEVVVEKAAQVNKVAPTTPTKTQGAANNKVLIMVIAGASALVLALGIIAWWQWPNFVEPTYSASQVFKNSSRSIVKLKLVSKALAVEFKKYKLTDKHGNAIYVLVDEEMHPSLYSKGKRVDSLEGEMHIGDAEVPITVKLNGLSAPSMIIRDDKGKSVAVTKGMSLEPYNIRTDGSGFFVRPDVLVTNYHLLAPANIGMQGFQGGVALLAGNRGNLDVAKQQAIGVDEDHDVALIYVPGSNATPLPLSGDLNKLEVGEKIYAIGSPRGVDSSMTNGVISSDRLRGLNPKDPDSPKLYIQHSAKIDEGNDGGPLLNSKGKVVGVNCTYVGNGAVNLAVAAKFVEELLAKPDVIEKMKALSKKAGTDLHG